MASNYKIHRPYVLATLPRPLAHTDGRIVARQVYGRRDGQTKLKKRMELAVGIDGEMTSIYNIAASRLITSYPIPPQESFTCPPYSVRCRRSNNQGVSRYTYVSTKDAKAHKITLFKDIVHPDGKTTSITISQMLQTSPVRYITSPCSASAGDSCQDLVIACRNGEIVCISGEDLKVRWTATCKSILQDAVAETIDGFEIEFVSSGDIMDFRQGMFRSRPEVFKAIPEAIGSDPSLLFMVVNYASRGRLSRYLVVLATVLETASSSSTLQKLIPLDVSPLRKGELPRDITYTYQVDISAGLLMELGDAHLNCYNITSTVPKKASSIPMQNAQSFARLARPFLLCASSSCLTLLNHQFRCLHAKTSLDLSELPIDDQQTRRCQLITYMRNQEIAIALIDNTLVSIQIEPPKHNGKRRKEGLLIDSIGRGTVQDAQAKRRKGNPSSGEFSCLLPGTITDSYRARLLSETRTADELLTGSDLAAWEELLREKFAVKLQEEAQITNGPIGSDDAVDPPDWNWLNGGRYPVTDRRWIIYAISRVFSVEQAAADDSNAHLRLVLPDSTVTTYLVVAGHLTISNIISAFRDELQTDDNNIKTFAGDLINSLVDADPSMTLLLNYLQATRMGEVELLLSIRSLMSNMELLPETTQHTKMKLLTSEGHHGTDSQDIDLDDLERDIAVMEHYLGDHSGSRSRGLTLAFTKLWRTPAVATVKALRDTISTEDLLAFIYLLRVEMIRGAWTSLYLDPSPYDQARNDPPPDGVITLLADLLGRCLDAVGAGGWLFNDAWSLTDKAEAGNFLSVLKREVNVSLEGIEEAVRLNSVVGEVARFGAKVEKHWTTRQSANSNKPKPLPIEDRECRLLPLGLKTRLMPTREKVVSGGEVLRRSARQTGHLLSQSVEAYSVERLTI